eukprot:scaffold1290_cov248-Ochromonas_danica.AAC.15
MEQEKPLEDTPAVSPTYTCRICLEDDIRSAVIAPCACRGSQQWVHRTCLDRWRSLVIFAFAGLVYLIDNPSHWMANKFHLQGNLMAFYYLMGLFGFFALVGMIAIGVRYGCCPSCGYDRSAPFMGDPCCDCLSLMPYYYMGPSSDAAVGADCCSCCHPACLSVDCCGAGCCDPICASASGDCCSAGMAGMGEEVVIIMVVVLVIFAVVGVFVSMVLGVVVLQTVAAKHWHILHKYNLTQEYIVKDLAPDAIDNPTNYYHKYEQNDLENGQEMPPWQSRDGYIIVDREEKESNEAVHNIQPSAPPAEPSWLTPQQREELTRFGLV